MIKMVLYYLYPLVNVYVLLDLVDVLKVKKTS